jgi:outer membrane receptor for ferrienterochelin and colicins
MKRISLFFAVFAFYTAGIFSQNNTDANIFGHVINKSTNEHIPFVNIVLKGTTIGTATDATGHYFLKNLPVGKFVLMASGLGYKHQEIEVDIVPGKSLEIEFKLDEDAILFDNIVVSANRNETNRKEAPAIINVISPKVFENTNSVSLAQGLNFQPGLRVETNCQNCGFQQVRINGLDGPYSQILIDSRPIFSSLAGVYGLEQIPANMIERVEVLRGGGSALFGSSAIAGTINIIIREPQANSISISNTTNFIYGKGADVNTSLNASVVSDNNKSGFMFFGSARQRAPFDYDNDGFTELTKINSKNIGFRGYYRTSNYTKLTVEYHNLYEFRRGGSQTDLPPHEADIAEQLEHNINSGGIKYDIFSKDYKHRINLYTSLQGIDRKSYYGALQDLNAYGQTKDFSLVTGAQYNYSLDKFLFMPADITLGIEYNLNDLNDKVLGYNRILNQTVDTKSGFVQNEWKNKEWSILMGARFDKHNLINKLIISPRMNLRYSPTPEIGFRASYSTGFRAPQAFDEDLHITFAGGEASIIRISPNLETEKSKSFSASADFSRNFGFVQANLLLEGFYTNLDNVFVLEDTGIQQDGYHIFERRNGSGAIVQGLTIEGILATGNTFQLQMGATFQKSNYKQAQQWANDVQPQKRMFRAPGRYGYITATYNPLKIFNISLSGTYTGNMLVQHFAGYIPNNTEFETPEFFDLNLKLAYDFAINGQSKFQVNTGIQNIFNSYQSDFDKGLTRDASYIYGPSMPRTYFFGIKFTM